MKKFIIMLMAACLFNTQIFAQTTTGLNSQKQLEKELMDICTTHGDKSKIVQSLKRNPESGNLISKVYIVPFNGTEGKFDFNDINYSATIESMMERAQGYFEKGKDYAYSYAHLLPGQKADAAFGTWVGDDKSSFVKILDAGQLPLYEVYYLEVKNSDDPTLRDFYALIWKKYKKEKAINTSFEGYVYCITSKRPDLIARDAEDAAEQKNDADDIYNALPGISKQLKVYKALAESYKKEMEDLKYKRKFITSAAMLNETDRLWNNLSNKYNEILEKMHALIMSENE